MRFKISGDDVSMLSSEEINFHLSNKNIDTQSIKEIVKNRRSSFSIVWLNGQNWVHLGRQSAFLQEEIKKVFLKSESSYFIDSVINGNIGNKGFIIGKAKIVLTSSDVKKIKKGDILISSMTSPDLIAGMEKAAAFVTDEGGITCHAAILSREFNVPCVIGTNVATKIIKDGDIITVDANDGKVFFSTEKDLEDFNKKSTYTKIIKKRIPIIENNNKIKKSNKLVIDLEEVEEDDYPVIGGKGSSLAKMKIAGFNVPDAFIITTNLFKKITADNEKLIFRHFEKLDVSYVSVRSSATVEDSLDNSFAGQFDTYLNVPVSLLIQKIRQCWKGVNNDRVKKYCKRNNIDRKKIKLAVVVQKMINSNSSGVIFTNNPLNKDQNETLIEAVLGLGEALVSGTVTPDTYIYNKSVNKVTSIVTGKQKTVLVRNSVGENEWYNLDKEIGQSQKINSKQIVSLGKKAIEIEKYYKMPMDIEWAIENNTIYILQSRPITGYSL